MKNLVFVITGPTATGKTELGVRFALETGGEVISADSMQIYRRMSIGTAKPEPEELRGVPHHMLDVADPRENWSVSRYAEAADAVIRDVLGRGKLPILVGGTGQYIDAVLRGTAFAPSPEDPELRRRLGEEYDRIGGEEFLRGIARFDPASAARLHPNDRKRAVRAREIYELTGRTMTEHDEATKLLPPRYASIRTALTFRNREDLYRRIDLRVEKMFARGLEDEVRSLLASGVDAHGTAMQAIGYKELAEGERLGRSREETLALIQQESRRYAKRQLSWLRRDGGIHWIEWDAEPDFERGLETLLELRRGDSRCSQTG